MKSMSYPIIAAAVAVAAPFLMTLPEAPPLPEGVAEVVEPEPEPSWQCPTCSVEEQYVLAKLQEKTKITDKNALATLMGNIKQESKFIPNICEGGARVSYTECKSGGFGLIQWTSIGRYKGLGNFCAKYGCDPSSLEGQTRYMINEPIFQRVLPEFEGSGQSISQYMVPAYYWLGWGIKGNREVYAYDYESKLTWV
ncbi:hypothetical protein Np121112_200 [Cyanophage S-RIM12_Np_22_1112]|uniref:Phage tail lysozyme domain-containing protein n=2 Tax=root TaxID=1 RepID=A0A1D7SPT1_9CAUD|nr:hypothetical protein Np121112_200 [Cyanophage S-RIM12_Np_22_1112]